MNSGILMFMSNYQIIHHANDGGLYSVSLKGYESQRFGTAYLPHILHFLNGGSDPESVRLAKEGLGLDNTTHDASFL